MSSYTFNPAYDGSDTATFRIGPAAIANTGSDFFSGVGVANAYYTYILNHLPVRNVDITVTGVKVALNISGAGATAAGAYLVVMLLAENANPWNPAGTALCHYAVALDSTSRTSSAVVEWTGLNIAVPTLPNDKDVFIGVCFPKTDAGATIVGGRWDSQLYAGSGYAWCDTSGVAPATGATSTMSLRAENRSHMKVNVTFTTTARRLYSVSSINGAAYYAQKTALLRHKNPNFPVRLDGGCYYIIHGWKARTADSNDTAPVMTLYKGDADGTAASQGTMTWSFVAAGAKTLTFGTAADPKTNNLATAGDHIELSSDTYDLALYMNQSRGKSNLFYQNMTHGQAGGTGEATLPDAANVDIATISHAAKSAAARNSEYAMDWEFCGMSFDAGDGWQITTLEIGWDPLILFGDSQVSTASSRLGTQLPAAFTHDRAYWTAWVGGTRLSTDGATYVGGYQRYKSDTPGVTDLCEMRDTVFVFCGMGINDLGRVPSESAETVVAELGGRVSTMLTDWYAIPVGITDGRHFFFIGLPPLKSGYSESTARNAAIVQWNDSILDNAMTRRIPFYSPHLLVTQNLAAYIAADNLHYTEAGATAVAAAAVAQYEAGYYPLTMELAGALPNLNRPAELRNVSRPADNRLRL